MPLFPAGRRYLRRLRTLGGDRRIGLRCEILRGKRASNGSTTNAYGSYKLANVPNDAATEFTAEKTDYQKIVFLRGKLQKVNSGEYSI